MRGDALLPVLVLGVVKVCKQKIYISLLQNCYPELLLQGKSHPKYSPYVCTFFFRLFKILELEMFIIIPFTL